MNEINITYIEQLPLAAEALLKHIGNHRIIPILGEMGVGKTTFIQQLCKALGVIQAVSSPTFSLVNEYQTRDGKTIYHFDFYRIKNLNEVYDIGYEDYFYSGNYCFIEWPERIEPLLSSKTIWVEIRKKGDERKIIFNQS